MVHSETRHIKDISLELTDRIHRRTGQTLIIEAGEIKGFETPEKERRVNHGKQPDRGNQSKNA